MSTAIYSANYHPSSISLFHDLDGYYHLIYMIVNKINNKIYIGKHTTKNPYDDYMGSGKAINAAIKKYGEHNFLKKIIYCCDTENEAYLKEIEIVTPEFIERTDTYNMKCGGKGFCSYDIRGNKHPKGMKGKISPMKGKHHTLEAKEKLSNAGKNRVPPNKGVPMSDEQKQKLSNAKLGKPAPNKGVPMSDEQKQKLSESLKKYYKNLNKHPKAKEIQKLDLDNNIVSEYESMKKCCLENGMIKETLLKYIKISKPYNGFYYKYKE